MDISPDLKVTQPTVTLVSNTFIKIENYLSIITYDTSLIKIKTKVKTIKITGDKLLLKYIETEEIGIKGLIYSLEYVDQEEIVVISFIRGYYTIVVEGLDTESFLNYLIRNKIYVYNVNRIEKTKIEFKIR